MVSFMSDLQGELRSLGGSVQVLLSVVGLEHGRIPLLRITVRWNKIAKALRMKGTNISDELSQD